MRLLTTILPTTLPADLPATVLLMHRLERTIFPTTTFFRLRIPLFAQSVLLVKVFMYELCMLSAKIMQRRPYYNLLFR